MAFSLSSLAIVATILSTASSHMIMKTPAPFSAVPPDNSPLSSSGANFPCKYNGSPSYYETSNRTSMAIGESQTLSFTGSAVHGGGSCQLAVTSDKAPTVSTSWQVILSIEGGCPSITGDGPSTYNFQIPDGIATGDGTLAWTWISKLAGQPEYYMNCAPITITGGSKKRSTENLVKRSDFPELFVANLASVNECKAGPGVDVIYPSGGPNIMYPKPAASMTNGTVTGTNCIPKVTAGSGGSGGSAPTSAASVTSAAGAGTTPIATPGSSVSVVNASPPTSSATSIVTSDASQATSNAAGGATDPTTSSAYSDPSSASISSASAEAPAGTTLISLSLPTPNATSSASPPTETSSSAQAVAPPAQATSATQAVSPAASQATAPSQSSSTSSSPVLAGQLSGSCTPEGQWNCLTASGGGLAYQRCASGSWTGMTDLAQGQTCQMGLSMTLWGRGTGKFWRA